MKGTHLKRSRAQPVAWIAQTGRFLSELIVPRTCAACHRGITAESGYLCDGCAKELAAHVGGAFCATCGEDRGSHLLIDGRCTACRQGRSSQRYDRFLQVGAYGGVLRSLILRFKTECVLDELLGGLLAAAVVGQIDPAEVACWVPVPAHWWRRLCRGFQPTDLLARAAARSWGGHVIPALKVVRYVRPFHQSGRMTAADRARAVSGAFAVNRTSPIRDRTVAIVDDVTTTGATLNEAKRALLAGGAARVFAVVIAKVPRSKGV